MTKVSYRKAKLSDALCISILLKTVYIQTYALDGITIEFANFITKRFSLEVIENTINQNPNNLIVAYHNANPIGVAEISYASKCPIKNIPVPELSKLYVMECFNGTGVGYGILQEVEKEVSSHGFKKINLEVYLENERALRFYKRQGYLAIGTVACQMETNTYQNIILNKVLN